MGVETNTYQIPDLVLSDTFYEWFTVTNGSIIEKLNLMKLYQLGSVSIASQGTVVGDGISAGTDTSGNLFIEVGSTIDKDITFNGSITVNGSTTTINSTEFTVDDFNIILGATGVSADDDTIMNSSGNSAGGGIIVKGSSGDKEFLWKYTNAAWNTNQNISLDTGKAILGATDIRLATGASGGTAPKGLLIEFGTGTTAGTTGSDTIFRSFNTDIAAGHSSDVMRIDDDGYVSIANGANKITVTQTGHGLTFGNVVYMKADGEYTKALGDNPVSAEAIGVVSKVITTDRFEITTQGEIIGDFSGVSDESASLVAGAAYFVSPSTSGNITGVKPANNGEIQKTILIGLTGDRGFVKNYIGGEVSLINQASQALTSNKIFVTQSGHGFTAGDAVYSTSTSGTFQRGIAIPNDTENTSDIVGIVEEVGLAGDADTFSLVMSGKFSLVDAVALVPGDVYYLKDSTPTDAPNITNSRLVTDGRVDKPLFVATDTNQGIVAIQRGVVLESEVEDDIITDVPVGAIIAYHGGDVPDGYLLCNGQSVDKSDYAALYSRLQDDIDLSDLNDPFDETKFILPDLRDRFIVGSGNGYNTTDTGGADTVTLTVDQMPSHRHNLELSNSDHTGTGAGVQRAVNNGLGGNVAQARREQRGGDQPHENRPPYYALVYLIRAAGVNPLTDGTQILGGDLEYIPIVESQWDFVTNNGAVMGDYTPQSTPRFVNIYGGQIFTAIRSGQQVRTSGNSTAPFGDPAQDTEFARFSTFTLSVPLLDILPVGTNAELVRELDLGVYHDNDFTDGFIMAKGNNEAEFRHLSTSQTTNGHGTNVVFQIEPGTSFIEFRIIYRAYTNSAVYDNVNGDGMGVWMNGFRQVRDNTIIRERKSYTDRKNLLINGNFNLWQRGIGTDSAFTDAGSSYFADRWVRISNVSSGATDQKVERKAFSLSQNAVPHNPRYYTRLTTPNNSDVQATVQGKYGIEQRIEDVRTLAGKNMTISFWAKASTTGSIGVGYSRFYGGDGDNRDGRLIKTVAVGPNWRKYVLTTYVPPIPNGKTEFTDSQGYFNSFFAVSLFTQLRTDVLGNDTGSTIDLGGGTELDVAQVQVEEGARATEFEILAPGAELALAQRYYSKSLAPHLAPTASGFPDKINFAEFSVNHTANCDIVFPVEMRATPACTLHGSAGTEDTIYMAQFSTTQSGSLNTGTPADIAVTSKLSSHRNIHTIVVEDNGIAHYNCTIQCNYTADAEL
jgi:microcystin-dependent protein